MKDKLLINVCLTGCVHSKDDNSALPMSPDEIANDVERCHKLGAQIFHIHARDNNANPTWTKDNYQKIINMIRIKCPSVVICVSTSGRYWNELDKRSECLDCEGVDMASLTLGSLNFYNSASCNSPDMIRQLLSKMNDRGIKPELEVFEIGHLFFAHRLIKEGLLKPPYYFNILFGSPWSMPLQLDVMFLLLNNMTDDSIFSFAGIGKFQYEANQAGLLFANGIRIGLEDNLKMGNELTTNSNLVQRMIFALKGTNRELATVDEARTMLCKI